MLGTDTTNGEVSFGCFTCCQLSSSPVTSDIDRLLHLVFCYAQVVHTIHLLWNCSYPVYMTETVRRKLCFSGHTLSWYMTEKVRCKLFSGHTLSWYMKEKVRCKLSSQGHILSQYMTRSGANCAFQVTPGPGI